MLKAEGITKTYAKHKVLDAIDLELVPGRIYGLLGPNGAGKSTLFKILCGLVKPDQGIVTIRKQQQKSIGAIIEQPGLYTYLNAWENLKIFARIQHASYDRESLKAYLSSVGLPLERKDPVRNFSMGMKQRLGIAIALLNKPKILILDEPFSGLDPIGVAALIKLIRQLAGQQMAILLSSHLINELYKCSNHLYVIDKGRIIHSDSTNSLINRFVSSYTIEARGIEHAAAIQDAVIETFRDRAEIRCTALEISNLLQGVLAEGFQVTSCYPNITLKGLLNASR